YNIAITTGDSAGVGPFARERAQGDKSFLVTDRNVASHARQVEASLQGAGFQTAGAVLPPGEEQKSLQAAAALYDALVDFHADRRTLVVAVGGGVVGDLAGFVAATFNRGLALLMVPTTLLAMVDSSVGGKVAVNHPRGKNLIGAFHQPAGVWIDTDFLETLPGREYRSGLAEVVKYGVILDPELFAYLEAHAEPLLRQEPGAVRQVVARSCRLKADVVEQDERELTGLRAVLNYGHTFAHAFETVGGYGSWLHGEAVAAGMVCARRVGERRGVVAAGGTAREGAVLRGLRAADGAAPLAGRRIVVGDAQRQEERGGPAAVRAADAAGRGEAVRRRAGGRRAAGPARGRRGRRDPVTAPGLVAGRSAVLGLL